MLINQFNMTVRKEKVTIEFLRGKVENVFPEVRMYRYENGKKVNATYKFTRPTSITIENIFAIVTISPKALNSLFELPKEISNQKDFDGFIATLNQIKGDLKFHILDRDIIRKLINSQ